MSSPDSAVILTLGTRVLSPARQPDLAVLDVGLAGSGPGARLEVTVANLGNVVAPAARLHVTWAGRPEAIHAALSLAPGVRQSIPIALPTELEPRRYIVVVQVEPAAGSGDARADNDNWQGPITIPDTASSSTAVVVPRLRGLTIPMAGARLDSLGLVLGRAVRSTRGFSGRRIVDQHPGEGSPAHAGMRVTVVMDSFAVVPDLLGADQNQAEHDLVAAGLRVGRRDLSRVWPLFGGHVVWQSDSAGTWRRFDSPVNLRMATTAREVLPWGAAAAVAGLGGLGAQRPWRRLRWKQRVRIRVVPDAGQQRVEDPEGPAHTLEWRGILGEMSSRIELEAPDRPAEGT